MVTVFLSQLEYKLREQDFLLFIRVAPRTVLGTQLELSIHWINYEWMNAQHLRVESGSEFRPGLSPDFVLGKLLTPISVSKRWIIIILIGGYCED